MASRYTTAAQVLEDVAGAVGFGSDSGPISVSSVDIFGSQPLKVATTWGDPVAVGLLLDAGAAIDAKHEDGDTALIHAIRMGEFAVARLLIARGANKNIRNDEGKLARDYCWEGEWKGLGL
jgi:ankyrin repeat protein